MSERNFTAQLAQLYREPQRLSDEDEFIAALHERIEQERRRRRGVLASCGLIGGGVSGAALWQLDAASWTAARVSQIVQPLHSALDSIGTVHLSVLGVALVLAVLLRELIHVMTETD